MATRLELHDKLKELLGSNNVYYMPPESVKIEYPAIVYSKNRIESISANDSKYLNFKSYEVIVIDRKPDNEVIDELLQLPLCTYERHYVVDNLNHDVLTLYY